MQQVWVDCDAGFDDLLAVQMVARDPDFIIAGLSLVAGNSELNQVIDNARRMAALLDWTFPLHAGAARPLIQELKTAADVLGPHGMRTSNRWFPDNKKDMTSDLAVKQMAKWLIGLSRPAPILALGPLTNLALLFREHPEVKSKISELVIMGGSTDRGNSTAVAEFNIHTDPEAAAKVFSAGVNVRMVGLNVCRQVMLQPSDIDMLRTKNTELHDLLADLMEGYLCIRSPNNPGPMPLYDPVAAAALLKPESIVWEQANVSIELSGEYTRGMTVCEFRIPRKAKANALVGVKAISEEVRQVVFTALDVNFNSIHRYESV